MPRNRFVSVLAIAALAGVLVTAGCGSAANKPPAATATASARVAAATGGTANIMIYGVNTDGAYWHAIVSGVIGDYGPAVSIYPDGQVDPAHNGEMELRLTGGSLSFPVILTLNEVEARPCQPSPGAFRAQLISVAGSGTISF